jgi:cytochrome P450
MTQTIPLTSHTAVAPGLGAVPVLRIPGSARKAAATFSQDRFGWNDRACELGPLSQLQLGAFRAWIITDPNIARDLLVTDAANWIRPAIARTPIRLGVGENLFTQSEKAWAAMQPTLSPSFRKRALEPRLANMAKLIEAELDTLQSNEPVDVVALTGRLAMSIAASVLFGFDLAPERSAVIAKHQYDLVTWVGHRVGSLLNVVPFSFSSSAKEMRKNRKVLEEFAADVIAHGRARTEPADDVLDALLAARPKGKPLNQKELIGHVLGMLLAGNETTALALGWAVVHGAENPLHWARLRDEPFFAEPFITESMRLNPTVWGFSREGRRNAKLAGRATSFTSRNAVIYLRGMNRRADLWEDPLTFFPERHIGADSSQKRALQTFALGPRMCIGLHLAMAEMCAVLPAIARLGDIVLESTPVPDPLFATRAKGGILVRFVNQPRVAEPQSPTAAQA